MLSILCIADKYPFSIICQRGVFAILTILLGLVALFGGLAGALLRANELSDAYSGGLAVAGHPLTSALIAVSVLVALALGLIITFGREAEAPANGLQSAWMVRLAAGLVLLFAPDELAPAAYGPIEVTVKWGQLGRPKPN